MKVGLEPTTWVLNMTLLYHLSYFIHCEPAGPLKDTTGSDCYVSKFCVPPKNLLLEAEAFRFPPSVEAILPPILRDVQH